MIHEETDLLVADNSGAKRVRCFRVLRGTRRRYGYVGDVVLCSVKEADPRGVVKRKDVVRCVIVRTRYPVSRRDGTTLRFYDNSCVIIDDKNNPKGTRIFGPVAREVREEGFLKIVSLAPEVI